MAGCIGHFKRREIEADQWKMGEADTMRQNRRQILITVSVLLLTFSPAWAEICKGPKVPKTDLAQYDAQVALSLADQATALQTHLPYGQPSCPKLLPQQEYILCFDPVNRIALWAAYKLTAEDVMPAQRLDAFRTDPRLTEDENAHCDDYGGTGYARGHAVPRDDMNRSPAAQANTFFLSNMSPQVNAFNGGIWSRLERLVRDYAKQYDAVYVITGSVLQEPVQHLPSGRVAIPSRFYKVLVRTAASGTPDVLAIVLPHLPFTPGPEANTAQKRSKAADAYLAAHTVSLMEIEHLTGMDLLPNLNAESLKKAVASKLWPRN
jgi:endonuclease G